MIPRRVVVASLPFLFPQAFEAANERILSFVKAVELMYLTRDADANADPNFACRFHGGAQPERAFVTQVDAIRSFVDIHCFRETPGASRKVREPLRSAMLLHQRNSFEWFESAKQNARADAGLLA